jgi:hypothetical protein
MSAANRTTSFLAVVSLSVMTVVFGACDFFDDPVPGPPPTPPGTEPKTAQKGPGSDPGQEQKPEEYRRPDLPIGSRRDPFVFEPPKAEVEEESIERQLEPLEGFDINQLKLVAVLTGTVVPKAMFLDPTSFGHIAKEEDRIGRDGGRIVDIRSNEVEVMVMPKGAGISDSGNDEAPAEPVILVIRLSDTEIPELEEEGAGKDGAEDILDALEGGGEDPNGLGANGTAARP